jgi:hypothetical protein
VLTPKSIVRRKTEYNARDYYNDFIIPFLEQEEIRAGSSLVKVLKKRRTSRRRTSIPHARAASTHLNEPGTGGGS